MPVAADHHLLTFQMSLQVPKPVTKSITTRPLYKLSTPGAQQLVTSINWNLITNNPTQLNLKFETFTKQLIGCINQIAPIKQTTINTKKYAPWMVSDLVNESKRVQAIYRKYHRRENTDDLENYRSVRTKLIANVTAACIEYYRGRIINLNGSAVWTELRQLGLVEESQHSTLAVSIEGLNIFFTSNSSVNGPPSNIITTISTFHGQLFDFQLVTPDTVQKALLCIKSYAIGVDNLSKKMIALTLLLILDNITSLLNESLNTTQFPESWKRALITPIKKVSQLRLPSYYRQIAILLYLSKGLEKIVFTQLTNHLKNAELLNLFQCGFK